MNAVTVRFGTGIALIVLAGAALGQAAERSAVRKPARASVESWHEPGLVAVKFQDGARVRLRAGELSDEGTGSLAAARDVLAGAARGSWQRAHHVDEAELERQRAEGIRRSGRELPDLNLEYRVQLEPGADAAAAIDALNALDVVELAWPVGRPAPPPAAPDYTAMQGYLGAATGGIGARASWPRPGGTGHLVHVVDVEYEFNASHVDLPVIPTIGPPAAPSGHGTDHATAVLGQLFALANGDGVTGMAHQALPAHAAAFTASGWNVAAAISSSTALLGPGDVILIEQQAVGPMGGTAYVPSEWDLSVYNAIRTAVANGIHVVEAAGNGGQDLDAAIYNQMHAPFLPQNDSGALIVGAGASPGGSTTDRSRLSTSNYGATVDLQGWGENVTTTGYGNLYSAGGVNEHYTDDFSGTSSASPMVAAACALLGSMVVRSTGSHPAPATMRELLRSSGSPQTSGLHPATQNIGPRPNLVAAAAELELFRSGDDDAWVQSFPTRPAGRRDTAIAYDSARRRVLIYGGENGVLVPYADLWAYGDMGFVSVPTSGSPGARNGAAMAYDSKRDRLVLFGGMDATFTRLGDTWELDCELAVWTLRSTTGPAPRYLHRMVYDPVRERVVMIGGSTSGPSGGTWEWNGTSWVAFAGGPSDRYRPGLAYDSDRGRIVLHGGFQPGGAGDSGETWERTGTSWALVSNGGPGARSGAGLCYDPGRRRTVLYAGVQATPFQKFDDCWEWNGSQWREALQTVPLAPRSYHALAFHEAGGLAISFGGDTTAVATDDFLFRQRPFAPGVPFCFGDGTGAACPCGNASSPFEGAGCLNSLGSGGKLRSQGIASLQSGGFVILTGSGMPDGSALYFQGTTQQAGGAGSAFGDGLRCAAGAVIRLGIQTNVGGSSQYPSGGQPLIPQQGLVTAPGIRTYQVWYRNAQAFCTASSFNLTNALQIVWGL